MGCRGANIPRLKAMRWRQNVAVSRHLISVTPDTGAAPSNNRAPGVVVEGIPVPGEYLDRGIELTEVSGAGIEAVPNLLKYRLPVSDFTEPTEVSGTGIEFVPNLPKCRVPV